jgi:hypothetical protein
VRCWERVGTNASVLDAGRPSLRNHCTVSPRRALALSGCGDECSSYSEFSCEQIQNADYNVEFNIPSGTKIYHLGQAKSAGMGKGPKSEKFASGVKRVPSRQWALDGRCIRGCRALHKCGLWVTLPFLSPLLLAFFTAWCL